uniref:Protein SHQ1 homolog n=1 Tax=Salarias fasciatus TaxID=181472 RepID=A0A672HSW2_SALFA
MITPAFDLSQDPDFLILSIRVPYTRTSEFDLYIDGTDFKFYAKPYFLRLTLPGRIVEDGREKAKFDIDKGLFTLHVPKETSGENFEGLQMLTSLLAPKGSRSAKPLVEDLGGEEDEEEEEEFDWQVEQEVYEKASEEELGPRHKYGFANQRSGVFARLQEELSDVIDLKNPEETSAAERRRARLQAEASAFSPDHYLADLFEDDEIKGLLKFKPWWTEPSRPTEQEAESAVSFTDDEKQQLRKFTNRSYLLDKASRRHAWLGLLDVLLAYCYEVRSTEGDHNVESPWTIRKLSGTLCWLETYSCLQEVLVSFGRRVLCYPLYRHFALVSAAVRDATKVLQSGRTGVLKCLLDVHRVFRENDPAYILNDLYITDYCIWIQRVKSKKVASLAEALRQASVQKKDLELELDELEHAATLVVEEEEEEESESDGSSEESEEDSTESDEGGGGGERAEASKDGPPQPQPPAHVSHVPQAPASAVLSEERSSADASPGCRQLIRELGERVAQELRISPDCSGAQASGRTSCGTLLEPSPPRNPLLIVQTQLDPTCVDYTN